MNLKPIEQLSVQEAKQIRFVLTDIDDTLTKDGKLQAEAFSALWQLKNSGLVVIAVTGRAAAWGYLLCQTWPVDAVITENGAITYFIRQGQLIETLEFPHASKNTHPALLKARDRTLQEVEGAKLAQDNHLRLYDLAIDHAENIDPPLESQKVERIIQIFNEEGCNAQASSIHVNTWIGSFNKKEGTLLFLKKYFNYQENDNACVFYVGDALNDEPMFAHFKQSCGVANITKWLLQMKNPPTWICDKAYGEGFAYIAQILISKRT